MSRFAASLAVKKFAPLILKQIGKALVPAAAGAALSAGFDKLVGGRRRKRRRRRHYQRQRGRGLRLFRAPGLRIRPRRVRRGQLSGLTSTTSSLLKNPRSTGRPVWRRTGPPPYRRPFTLRI